MFAHARALASRTTLYIRGYHKRPWKVVVASNATVADVLRTLQRQYGVCASDAVLYTSRRLALHRSESIAMLGLDSLSTITYIHRLRGGSRSGSTSAPGSSASEAGTDAEDRESDDEEDIAPPPSTAAEDTGDEEQEQENGRPAKRQRLTRKTGFNALTDAECWDKDDAKILSDAVSAWKSDVYKHYTYKLVREEKFKRFDIHFSCIYGEPQHKVEIRPRLYNGHGTSNLRRPAKACDLRRGAVSSQPLKQLTITDAVSKYTPALHRAIIAMRTAVSNRPFSASEDKYYRLEVQLLRPGTVVPNRATTSRDIKLLHSKIRIKLQEYFKAFVGAVHVVVDGWTAPNIASYHGIVIVWWAKNKINRSVLELDYITESHTGEHLAERLAKTLNTYGIKPFTLCADNATNNDKLVRALPAHLPGFGGTNRRIRCFAHIINLMAKAYISFFFEKPKKRRKAVKLQAGNKRTRDYVEQEEEHDIGGEVIEDPDGIYVADTAGDDVDEAKDAYDTTAITKAASAAFSTGKDRGIVVSDDDRQIALGLFPKVAGLARRVHDATVLAARFKDLIEKDPKLCNETNKRALDRRVPTRWNSDLTCLDAHLLLRAPVKTLTSELSDLEKYKLSPPQWLLAETLHDVLQMFERPTKLFSQGGVPLVHDVVPLIEQLELKLEAVRDDATKPGIMRIAAIATLEVVAKYYARTDDTEVYRIAIIMCPYRKLKWFEKTWRPEDIAVARSTAIARFNSSYRGDEHAQPVRARIVKKKSAYAIDESDDDEEFGPSAHDDTIQAYLDSPIVPRSEVMAAGGLMPYWEKQRKFKPRLAQMALDFLSAPATSVDIERAFSNGRMKINHLQHNKSPETFQAQMSLASWDDSPFWPGIEYCAEVLEQHSSRSGPSSKPVASGSSKSQGIVVD